MNQSTHRFEKTKSSLCRLRNTLDQVPFILVPVATVVVVITLVIGICFELLRRLFERVIKH